MGRATRMRKRPQEPRYRAPQLDTLLPLQRLLPGFRGGQFIVNNPVASGKLMT